MNLRPRDVRDEGEYNEQAGLIAGILFIVLAALVVLACCEGDFYRMPGPRVEDIRNSDYPEPDTSFLAEQRRQEDEEMQFRRY